MIDKITLKTTNKLAEEFYKRYNDAKFMEKHRKIFMKMIKGKLILDVGCGMGRDTREFKKNGFDVVGMDVSRTMLNLAKKNIKETTFLCRDMSKIGITNFFDGVWCCSSFYHIYKEYAEPTLIQFYKCLKVNGILFITLKEGDGEQYLNKDYFGNFKKFYAFYKDFEILELLSKASFNVVYMEKEYKDQKWINISAKKYI